jgi:regulator of replication initiation timing
MPDQRDLRAELHSANRENQRLREENCRLKEIPPKHSIPTSDVHAKHNERQTNLPKPSEVAQAGAPTD